MTSQHSDFLHFSTKDDMFIASAADLAEPGLSFLRVEMARVRVGMNDYLMKVSSPKFGDNAKSNTVITLRNNRTQATNTGALATAKTIIAEMVRRGDSTFNWDKINADHLSRMLLPSLKFFSANTSSSLLRFETEALT